jgi:hypothetical protein
MRPALPRTPAPQGDVTPAPRYCCRTGRTTVLSALFAAATAAGIWLPTA